MTTVRKPFNDVAMRNTTKLAAVTMLLGNFFFKLLSFSRMKILLTFIYRNNRHSSAFEQNRQIVLHN